MKKELKGLEEGFEVEIYLHSEKHSKKYKIGKWQAMMVYKGSGFNNVRSIHNRLVLELSRRIEKARIPK